MKGLKKLNSGCVGRFWLSNPALEAICDALFIRYRRSPSRSRFEETRKILEALEQEQLVSILHQEKSAVDAQRVQ